MQLPHCTMLADDEETDREKKEQQKNTVRNEGEIIIRKKPLTIRETHTCTQWLYTIHAHTQICTLKKVPSKWNKSAK